MQLMHWKPWHSQKFKLSVMVFGLRLTQKILWLVTLFHLKLATKFQQMQGCWWLQMQKLMNQFWLVKACKLKKMKQCFQVINLFKTNLTLCSQEQVWLMVELKQLCLQQQWTPNLERLQAVLTLAKKNLLHFKWRLKRLVGSLLLLLAFWLLQRSAMVWCFKKTPFQLLCFAFQWCLLLFLKCFRFQSLQRSQLVCSKCRREKQLLNNLQQLKHLVQHKSFALTKPEQLQQTKWHSSSFMRTIKLILMLKRTTPNLKW